MTFFRQDISDIVSQEVYVSGNSLVFNVLLVVYGLFESLAEHSSGDVFWRGAREPA